MKNKLKLVFLSIGVFLMLAGCDNNMFIRRDIVTPPDYLTMPIIVEKPPLPNEYKAMDKRSREKVLFNLYGNQTVRLGEANIQFNNIKSWGLKQKALESKD